MNKFNEIITSYADFTTKVLAKYNLFYNEAPALTWSLLYANIEEFYGDREVLLKDTSFLRDFKNKLVDIIPKYNKQWKIAISDAFKNMTAEQLLENGTITDSENTTKTADTAGVENGVVNENYSNEIIKNTIKDKSLNANVLRNLSLIVFLIISLE